MLVSLATLELIDNRTLSSKYNVIAECKVDSARDVEMSGKIEL